MVPPALLSTLPHPSCIGHVATLIFSALSKLIAMKESENCVSKSRDGFHAIGRKESFLKIRGLVCIGVKSQRPAMLQKYYRV